jgi:hypothetical protein
MAGAANRTAGSITAHETSHDAIQFRKNRPLPRSGQLAIPAAIKLVSPDWMTPKIKWLCRLGIESIVTLCDHLIGGLFYFGGAGVGLFGVASFETEALHFCRSALRLQLKTRGLIPPSQPYVMMPRGRDSDVDGRGAFSAA